MVLNLSIYVRFVEIGSDFFVEDFSADVPVSIVVASVSTSVYNRVTSLWNRVISEA